MRTLLLVLGMIVSTQLFAGTTTKLLDLDDRFKCYVSSKGEYREIDEMTLVFSGTQIIVQFEFEGKGWDIWGESDFKSKEIMLPLNANTGKHFNPLFGPPFGKKNRSDANILGFLNQVAAKSKVVSDCSLSDAPNTPAVGAKVNKSIHDGGRKHGKDIDTSSSSESRKSRSSGQ